MNEKVATRREAVQLVLGSQATSFAEFRTYISGRGNAAWVGAITRAANTWMM
jgi:hypothetical protein